MSIQDYLTNPYLGYFFAFLPVTLYLFIMVSTIRQDPEARGFFTFKHTKGSWNNFWGPALLFGTIMVIAPLGWIAIIILIWKLFKSGNFYPGSYAKITEELKEKNEQLERMQNTCDSYRSERDILNDRYYRLEAQVHDYRCYLETVRASHRNIISQTEARNRDSQIDYNRFSKQIENEIERIKQ